MDKTQLFKDRSSANSVYVPDNKYSLGIEIEFKCGKGFATKYNKMVGRGDRNEMYSTLGFDGSGAGTKEFRSPVFISESPEDALIQLKAFTIEVEIYLLEEFKAKLAPYLDHKPYGVHFSLGGKFNKNGYKEYITRSRIIQPKLEKMIENEEDKRLFNLRESRYPGKISDNLDISSTRYWWSGCNAVRSNDYRLEFRYLPSAKVESLFPVIEFVILDTCEPINNKLEFIK